MTTEEARIKEAKLLDEFVSKICKNPFSRNSRDDLSYIASYIERFSEIELGLLRQKYPNAKVSFRIRDNEKGKNTTLGNCAVPFCKSSNGKFGIKGNYEQTINIFTAALYGNDEIGYDSSLTSNDRDSRIRACINLTDTILHEINHYEQTLDLLSGKKITYDALKMAEDFVLATMHGSEIYKENYAGMIHEIDSRVSSHKKIIDIINSFKSSNGIKYAADWKKTLTGIFEEVNSLEIDEARNDISFRHYGGREDSQDREYFVMQFLDREIKADPRILSYLPILKLEYDENGNRRKVNDLIGRYRTYLNTRKNDPNRKEMKRIYSELITIALEMASSDEIRQLNETPGIIPSKLYSELKYFNYGELQRIMSSLDTLKEKRINSLDDKRKKNKISKKRCDKRKKKIESQHSWSKKIEKEKYDRRIMMLHAYEKGNITAEEKYKIIVRR